MAAPARDIRFDSADGQPLALTVHDPDGAHEPAGLPVLLLHGLSQQRHFWGPVVRRMRSRPVAALDQRGHGEADTPLTADYSVGACAADVGTALDVLGWPRAAIVGHSWGASVALRAGAILPERVVAVALIDGGLWSPAGSGPRDEVRRRLTPPALGIPADDRWRMVRSGELGRAWSPELQAALEPTFVTDAAGNLRTRIGVERHMLVLDGLLDTVPAAELEACEAHGTPVWAVSCEPQAAQDDRTRLLADAARHGNLLVHRWSGAIHDVPLQWPSLVAGFIDAMVDDRDGGNE